MIIIPSRMKTSLVMVIGIVCLVGWGSIRSLAQEATPTLGPTKTPTPISMSAVQPSEQPNQTVATVAFDPLTQTDLSVLTGNVQRPNGIGWFDGNLYTACTGDSTIYEINDTTGATITYIFGINNAHMLHVEEDDNGVLNMWIPDYGANALSLVTRSGVRVIARNLNGPWGIVEVPAEALPADEITEGEVVDTPFLITNLLGNSLVLATRDGEITPLIEDLPAPAGIALDGEFVYIGNNGSTRRAIEYYPLADVLAGEIDPEAPRVLVSGLQNTTGLQMASDGYLYFAYALGTRGIVGRVDPVVCQAAGGCTNDQVEVVVFTELATPIAGLTVTPDRRIFLHTMFEPDIFWVQLP